MESLLLDYELLDTPLHRRLTVTIGDQTYDIEYTYHYRAIVSVPTIGVRQVYLQKLAAQDIYDALIELQIKKQQIDGLNRELQNIP